MKARLLFTLTLLLGFACFLTIGTAQIAQTYIHHDTLNEGTGLARALAFSPDRTLLASGGGRNVYLHDPGTGTLQRTLTGHTDNVMVVSFSPDGRMLASASGDRTIKLWNPQTGQLIRTLQGHTNQIYAMAFSPTGQLASGGRDNTVRFWNTQTGANRILGQHNGWVLGLAFSSTGLLASSSRDNTIRIWNATTGAQLRTLTGHTNFVTSVAFMATGDTLVSGSRDNTLRVWNAATGGAALQILRGHTDAINSVAVANRTIASASADETARLWNLQNFGEPIETFDEHTDLVRVVAFSRDGYWLASGSVDGTVQVWNRVVAPPVTAPPVVDVPTVDIVESIRIPNANLAAAIRAALELPAGTAITTDAMRELTELDASGREIVDLTGLEHAVNLTSLDLSDGAGGPNNPISNVSLLAGLTNLTELDLRGTNVSDISVLTGLTNLETLGLSNTDVSDVTVLENLTNLETLWLSAHDVSDISVLASLTNLVALGLAGTAVSDLSPLTGLTNLETLYLGGNDVSDISVLQNLTNLETLYLGATDVSDISVLQNLTNLMRLVLNWTDVSDISVLASLTNLERLELAGTAVSDLSPLTGLTNLEELHLSDTAVSDVSPLTSLTNLERLELAGTDVWDISVLAGTNLERLNLNSTDVSDISALAGLTNLTDLHLWETAVSDLSPLTGLTNLEELWLKGCPLSYYSIVLISESFGVSGTRVSYDAGAHRALFKVSENSGDGQVGAAGTALPNPFVVKVTDAEGQPIVDLPVVFEILGGGGSLSPARVGTDPQGHARVTLTPGSGVNKVRAYSEGIQSWALFTVVPVPSVTVRPVTVPPVTAPPVTGDVNGDGEVTRADLVKVAENYGELVSLGADPDADVNGDGKVDVFDILVVIVALDAQDAAGAPAIESGMSQLQAADVRQWLRDAQQANADPVGIAALEQLLASLVPKETVLLANYPNPFNPETWIPYQLAESAEVTVTIYAANGAVVRMLDLGHRRAGSYASRSRAAYWDGRNAAGEPVASGVYFYTFTAGEFSATRKMVIRK